MEDSQNVGTIDSDACSLCTKPGAYYLGSLSGQHKFSCDEHFDRLYDELEWLRRRKRFSNANLHLNVDEYEHSTTHKKAKITAGKAWEIEHRTLAEDGKTVINSVTGKPAEY